MAPEYGFTPFPVNNVIVGHNFELRNLIPLTRNWCNLYGNSSKKWQVNDGKEKDGIIERDFKNICLKIKEE